MNEHHKLKEIHRVTTKTNNKMAFIKTIFFAAFIAAVYGQLPPLELPALPALTGEGSPLAGSPVDLWALPVGGPTPSEGAEAPEASESRTTNSINSAGNRLSWFRAARYNNWTLQNDQSQSYDDTKNVQTDRIWK